MTKDFLRRVVLAYAFRKAADVICAARIFADPLEPKLRKIEDDLNMKALSYWGDIKFQARFCKVCRRCITQWWCDDGDDTS